MRYPRIPADGRTGSTGRARIALPVVVAMLWSASVSGAELRPECGVLDNPMGPFDYTSPSDRKNLPIVEQHHFTPEVESFQGHVRCGGNGCQVRDDLDYTLRAFPNHHRALFAIANYDLRQMDKELGQLVRSPSCYFDRAILFRPEDATVRMIFGFYLSRLGNDDGALEEYNKALELAPRSAEVHYNLGLIYADRAEYEMSRHHARLAYQLGFPLPGLRTKLERAGQWSGFDTEAGPAGED